MPVCRIPDVGHDAHDRFAVDFENHAQHAVRRGMLRPHVQDHGAILAGFEHGSGRHVGHMNEA